MSAVMRIALRTLSTFYPPHKPLVFSGPSSVLRVADVLIASGQRRPLLVTGSYLLKKGKLDAVIQKLEDNGCEVTIYSGPKPNPDFTDVEEGIRLIEKNKCDSILAIGGGSVIDTSKVISSVSTNKKSIDKMVGILKVKKPRLPFYVVPTTSGSGSETTSAAVVAEPVHHKKQFFVDAQYIPDAVALDPELLQSLPAKMTAAVGMDAMTHAIEAYTSKNKFYDTDKNATMAIKLLMTYLPRAYENGDDLEAREMVAQASFLAGYAFAKSSLGFVHAISHQLSGIYNTPHGVGNAVLLPKVMKVNQKSCITEYAELEKMFTKETSKKREEELAADFVHRIHQLTKTIDIPEYIDELNHNDFSEIAKRARAEARSSYAVPKSLAKKEIIEILEGISK